MSKRKIVQITSNIRPGDDPLESVYALCDDGSLWENTYTWQDDSWNGWQQLPQIPTPVPEPSKWFSKLNLRKIAP